MVFLRKKTIFVLAFLAIFFVLMPQAVFAEVEGSSKDFFVDSGYDTEGRERVSAKLHKISDKAYFYIEEDWYNNLTEGEKEKATTNLERLSQEFSEVIYPKLIQKYGSEWNPGIDSDKHVTILFHQIPLIAAGYFRSHDETSRLQNSTSNEREMVYLNSNYLLEDIIKSYLAHEFTHLITFNQKERLSKKEEEVWLNELRAEYASTLLGYDDDYTNSNLEERIGIFLDHPADSLTEWSNNQADYGVISAFANYLVDHYGELILTESLRSSKVGISSIQETFEKNYVKKEFWQVFSDWLVAVFLNDCEGGNRYCYRNENLAYIKISPSLIFLPPNQSAEFTLTNDTTYWAGNWYRIIGGADRMEVVFEGDSRAEFRVPYVLCRENYDCSVGVLDLNQKQEAVLSYDNFFGTYISLTLIPFVISKVSGFNGEEEYFSFSIKAAATPENTQQNREELIAFLKAQIEQIKVQIAELQVQLSLLLAQEGECSVLLQDLHFGNRGEQVECLQKFLAQQGSEIYPEGYVTGYFGLLTQQAVMRFQRKYAQEILYPLSISGATGYVGSSTRAKINEILE